MRRLTAWALITVILAGGCATAPPQAPTGAGDRPDEQRAALDRAACKESAKKAVDSTALGAALEAGTVTGAVLMLYGAAEGAWIGAIRGGSAGDGAWIGAAAGAGIGLVVGLVVGARKAHEARERYEGAFQDCLRERAGAPPAEPPAPEPEDPGAMI